MSYKLRSGRSVSTSAMGTNGNTLPVMSQPPATPNKVIVEKELTLKDVMEQLLENKSALATISTSVEKMEGLIDRAFTEIRTVKDDLESVKKDISSINSNYKELSGRVSQIDQLVAEKDVAIATVTSQSDQNARAIEKLQISNVNTIYKSMQSNVILQNVEELEDETNDECLNMVNNVINDVFQVDHTRISISVAHRMGSANVNGRRPIIFKLAKLSDKGVLWDNINNVSVYNTANRSRKVFVEMTQLPKKLANDKASLIDDFNAAKTAGLKPKWRYDKVNGQFCYVIGEKFYRPKVNFFLV